MKHKLLYLALCDVTKKNIAPPIRMNSMRIGFENILHDRFLCISGSSHKRAKSVRNLIFSANIKQYTHLYIESSNKGLNFWDLILLFYMKERKIPISIFIRDILPFYKSGWEFTNYKGKIANILWLLSFYLFKITARILYFPAKGMSENINFKKKRLLPPGINTGRKINKNHLKNSIFYAGGLKSAYDISPFLKACKELYKEIDISVIIYCRENERNFIEQWESEIWLEIKHSDLDELEFHPAVGIVPLKSIHSNLTIAVKFMDYLSLAIPVVVSGSKATELIVKKENIGLIAETGNWKSYYNKIKEMLTNEKLYNEFQKNILGIRNNYDYSWESRCQKVLNDFRFEK